MATMSHASRERQVLAAALRAVGPDAPTLCEGWTARDLAAHLVVREARPDTGPGALLQKVPVVSEWSEKVRRQYAERDFDWLVDQFAAGPPRLSYFALPRVDATVNLTEHFIHTEDVRRAQAGWEPRELHPRYAEALWDAVSHGGRLMFRNSPVGVVLVVPGGPRRHVRGGAQSVVLTGEPGELLLHASGRRDHALVEVTGPPSAVRAYSGVKLGI
jgi:uncharacterized protein (TIGR03085 family)